MSGQPMHLQVPRAHERRRVLWAIKLHHEDRVWEGEAVDVSAWGAKVRIAGRLANNSKVVLSIARLGSFRGEVRWQDAGYIGIRFSEKASAFEDRPGDAALAPANPDSGFTSDVEQTDGRFRRSARRSSDG